MAETRTYKRLSEVLEYVQTVHHRMRDICRRLARQTSSEMIEILMDAFGNHEQDLERALQDVTFEQEESIVGTWAQYVPTQSIDLVLERLQSAEQPTWEDVSEAVLEVQKCIAELWEGLADRVEAPPVQEVLRSLADAERAQSRNLSKQLLSLQEM